LADVFISYAHDNLRKVTPVSQQLQSGGLSLWWDKHLQAGDDFSLVIEREIAAAGSVLVLWSEAARNSLWVRAEATEALDGGKLVQARLDGVKPPLPFTIVEMVDLRRWNGRAGDQPWPHLVSTISGIARGSKPAVDDRVFKGPALQDFGSSATLGWICIALMFGTSFLTLALGGPNAPDARLYGLLTTAAFGASCLALVLTLARLVRTALATGRT
jgi:hypothetical protein